MHGAYFTELKFDSKYHMPDTAFNVHCISNRKEYINILIQDKIRLCCQSFEYVSFI